MFDRVANSGGSILIYQGGDNAPGTLVHTQSYTGTGIADFAEYELTAPVVIDATQPLWVVMSTVMGTSYPASCCDNTGDANGRWISTDGSTWEDVAGLGLPYTWMIRAYVEEGEPVPPTPNENILGVMVYRDGQLLTNEPITETTYTEIFPDEEAHEYCIRVVYGGAPDTTYYAMSCPQCVTLEPAIACEAPADLYGEYTYNEDNTFGATLTWPYTAPVTPTSEWTFR